MVCGYWLPIGSTSPLGHPGSVGLDALMRSAREVLPSGRPPRPIVISVIRSRDPSRLQAKRTRSPASGPNAELKASLMVTIDIFLPTLAANSDCTAEVLIASTSDKAWLK